MSATVEGKVETERKDLDTRTIFSLDRVYRYALWRCWGDPDRDGYLAFIGLNPSTADEQNDDPTIRRCIGFAKSFGCGNLLMLNLYAFRTVSPKVLWQARRDSVDIVGGKDNHFPAMQTRINFRAALTIAAWGRHGRDRGIDARNYLSELHYLSLNSDGTPKHPLYLKADLKPIPFEVPR